MIHDMPMKIEDENPLPHQAAKRYRLKSDVAFCFRDGNMYIFDDPSESDTYAFTLEQPSDFIDSHCEPIPDTPKPLWELMPEIVKGRRFRHVNTKCRVWRKISDCGNHFVDMDGASSPPIRSANFIEPNYILEPIE